MIRTILKARSRKITFNIPKQYLGKELEVIIFAKNEIISIKEKSEKNVTFDALAIDTTGYKFNREEANER